VSDEKKIFTRKEFEELRIGSAADMAADLELQKDALDVLVRADQYYWIHQTNWLGEPILNLPQDMFAIQEIIFKTRPEYIIEIGVAWGGSLLYFSTLMEVLGGKGVIGIDVFLPEDLRIRLSSHGKLSEHLTLVNASSIDKETVNKISTIVGDSRKCLVILDSHHSHDHVLTELNYYSQFVGEGNYIVVCDTIIENIPIQENRPRPWALGNNPRTALDQFLSENDRFEIDRQINNKLLLTCNYNGYLRCRYDR